MSPRRAGVLLALSLVAVSSCRTDEDDVATDTDETDQPQDTDDTDVDRPTRLYFSHTTLACDAASIRYVDVGTSDAVEVLAPAGPDTVIDLAVDAADGWIYFILGASNADEDDTVERVRVDGTGRDTLASYATADTFRPAALALDASSSALFWIEGISCGSCDEVICGGCPGIVRSDRTGGTPTRVYTTPLGVVTNRASLGHDAGASRLYMADSQFQPTVAAVGDDGFGFQPVVQGSAPGASSLVVDTAGAHLYWIGSPEVDAPVAIMRSSLNGNDVQALIDVGSAQAAARGLALDAEAGKLYWTESGFCGSATPGRIRRANLDGSDVETVAEGLGIMNAVQVVP